MVAYGLAKILKDNEFPFVIRQKKAYFEVEADVELPYENWVVEELREDHFWNTNAIYSKSEQIARLKKLNEFLQQPQNISSVFHFYETHNPEFVKNMNDVGMVYVNSIYFAKSVRGTSTAGSIQAPEHVAHLSFLGFLTTGSYVKTRKGEAIFVFYPKETSVLRQPYVFYSKEDKESGKRKPITYFGNDYQFIRNAILYLRAIQDLQKDSMVKDFESILIGEFIQTKNKSVGRQAYRIPVHSLSIDTCEKLLNKLEFSTVDEEVKQKTAQFVLYQTPDLFGKWIRTLAKSQKDLLPDYVLKELIQLQNERLKTIYFNESVKKIGRSLSLLLHNKDKKNKGRKGYNIQVALINCSNAMVLSNTLRDFLVLYKRVFDQPAVHEKDIIEILNLIETDEDVRMIADAILMYSSVWYHPKENKENDQTGMQISNENEIEQKEDNEENQLKELI